MRPRSILKRKKRLYNQLNRVQDLLIVRAGRKGLKEGERSSKRTAPTTVLTLRGRIEKRIQTIKNTKIK